MRLLATIGLLTFLTARGSEENDSEETEENDSEETEENVFEIFANKLVNEYDKIEEATLTSNQCVGEMVKKYVPGSQIKPNHEILDKYKETTKWDDNKERDRELKNTCFEIEMGICVNANATDFLEKLEGKEKQMFDTGHKAAVYVCKASLVGNDNCKADCDKLANNEKRTEAKLKNEKSSLKSTDVNENRTVEETDSKIEEGEEEKGEDEDEDDDAEDEKYEEFMTKIGQTFMERGDFYISDKTFKKCQKDVKKKYGTKWKDMALGLKRPPWRSPASLCRNIEDAICVVTNEIGKEFVEKFDDQEKEVSANLSEAAVLACQTFRIGYDECRADCSKLKPQPTKAAKWMTKVEDQLREDQAQIQMLIKELAKTTQKAERMEQELNKKSTPSLTEQHVGQNQEDGMDNEKSFDFES